MTGTKLCRMCCLCLWGLASLPVFLGAGSTLSFIAAGTALTTWAMFFIRWPHWFSWLSALLYNIAILYMLWDTQIAWIMPPAITGCAFVIGCLCAAGAKSQTKSIKLGNPIQKPLHEKTALFQSSDPIPHLSATQNMRSLIFYGIWGIGLCMIMISHSPYTSSMLLAWSCMMLFAARESIWIFYTSHEWLGYMTRRECFVSTARWRWRFVRDFALLGLLFAGWMLMKYLQI